MNSRLTELLVGSGLAPVLIPRKEFEAEHKRLLKVLKSENPRLLRKEYQTQKKELSGGLTQRETGRILTEMERALNKEGGTNRERFEIVESLLSHLRRALVRDGQFRGEPKRHYTEAAQKLGEDRGLPLTTRRLEGIWTSLEPLYRMTPVEEWRGGALGRDDLNDLSDAVEDFENSEGVDYTIDTFLEAFDAANRDGDLSDAVEHRDNIETRRYIYEEGNEEDYDYILGEMERILEIASDIVENEDEDEDVLMEIGNVRPETPTSVTAQLTEGMGRALRGGVNYLRLEDKERLSDLFEGFSDRPTRKRAKDFLREFETAAAGRLRKNLPIWDFIAELKSRTRAAKGRFSPSETERMRELMEDVLHSSRPVRKEPLEEEVEPESEEEVEVPEYATPSRIAEEDVDLLANLFEGEGRLRTLLRGCGLEGLL